MGEMEPAQDALFRGELAGFIAHVSWRPGEGWRVYVSNWDVGQLPSEGPSESYKHLTVDEAFDVLSAEIMTRCEWTRYDRLT